MDANNGGIEALKILTILGISITIVELHLYLSVAALIIYIIWLLIKIYKEFNIKD